MSTDGSGPSFFSSNNMASNGNEEIINDSDQPQKKKRRIVTASISARRPLSCTECKRRKTKCSSLGVTPCASCIRRGKPNDCKWENLPEGPQATSPMASYLFASVSDVETLKAQVQELYSIVQSMRKVSNSTQDHSAQDGMLLSPRGNGSHDFGSPSAADAEEVDGNLESAVSVLENIVEGGNPPSNLIHGQSRHRLEAVLNTPDSSSIPMLNDGRPSQILPILDKRTRRDVLLDLVFHALPAHHVQLRITDAYLSGHFHRGWRIFHEPSFRDEHAIFRGLSISAQRTKTDPAWIAVYLMVLSFGIQDISIDELQELFPSIDIGEIRMMRWSLYQASLLALQVAKSDENPQIRHIQACLLYFPLFFHFGSGSQDSNVAMRHLAAAITTAQLLNLDQLGSVPSKVPLNDQAFCKCSPAMAFELSKRLYHMLNFLDGTCVNPRLSRLPVTGGARSTELPSNADDDGLGPGPILKRSINHFTHATISIVASLFGTAVRTFGTSSIGEGAIKYDSILRYGADLVMMLDQLPSPLTSSQIMPYASEINWMQCVLFSSLHNRILRIHRPFMSRGYIDAKYECSRIASVDSAHKVIAAQRILIPISYLRPGPVKRWILGAAIVLTIDLIISIDRGHPSDILNNKRSAIVLALEILQQENPADKTPQATKQYSRTVKALLVAADIRLATFGSRQITSNLHNLKDFFNGVSASLMNTKDNGELVYENRADEIDFNGSLFPSFDPFNLEKPLENQMELPFNFDFFGGWEALEWSQ